jgi:hypothetical protein
MDELIFAGNKYISSKRASKLTGYTTDYIGQMCRGDKMDCRLVGRNWYINEEVVKAQKKSFKKEQLKEDKRAIEYKKLDLDPMYYSDDFRSNDIKVNKSAAVIDVEDDSDVEIKIEEGAPEEVKKDTLSVLHMVESPVVDLRDTKQEIVKSPVKQIVKREVLLPQKSPIRLPMLRIVASLLILVGILFTMSTFALQQTVHYTSSDKVLNTEYQIASVGNLFNF